MLRSSLLHSWIFSRSLVCNILIFSSLFSPRASSCSLSSLEAFLYMRAVPRERAQEEESNELVSRQWQNEIGSSREGSSARNGKGTPVWRACRYGARGVPISRVPFEKIDFEL